MRLADKVAIVAGGGMGIGRACARLFAQEGARLVLCDIDPQAGRKTTEEIAAERGRVIFVQADVSDEDQVKGLIQKTLEACGRIDILYSSVAIYMRGRLTDLDESHWDKIMQVNVKSAYLLCKAVIPHMQQVGGGSIILTSSSVGWQNSAPNIAAYTASKFAITGLTKSLACELLADRIRVNCLCPGPTDTPMMHSGRTPEELQAFIANLPGKRLADPLEIAEAALFLASEESRFITGVALPVDGGQTAWIS